jgi:D-alanyl-D-alanine carboxypeptidase (penicillin-binding protein 5/6)
VQARKRHRSSRPALVALLAVSLALLVATASPPPIGAAAAPQIVAPNTIVLDPDTGQVIFERDSHAHVQPASLTKIMTALIAIEHTDLVQRITVTREDLVGEASMGLRAGQMVSLETLLYGLILPSGNDAAMAIARGVAAQPGDATGKEGVARFVGWMNETAVRLGLRDTHYANPHGLDEEGHYSSAYDLARLTGIAWRDPVFARIFGSARYQGDGFALAHTHRLVGAYDGVVGGKIGLTDGCGFCLVTAAEHAEHRLVVVVLRETVAQAYDDTKALLSWTYGQLDTGSLPIATVAPTPSPLPPTPTPAMPTATITPTITPTSQPTREPSASPVVQVATPGQIAWATVPASPAEAVQVAPQQDRLRPIIIAFLATMLACGLVRKVRL